VPGIALVHKGTDGSDEGENPWEMTAPVTAQMTFPQWSHADSQPDKSDTCELSSLQESKRR
jgi:hypothetical protein